MGTKKEGVPPGKDRKNAGLPSEEKKAPIGGENLETRIGDARAALHDAIRRAGDKPLSQSPEVLRLSRKLDELIDEMQRREQDKND